MRSAETDLSGLDSRQLRRKLRLSEPDPSHPHALIAPDGSRLLDFSSNDYLGLASEPELAEALARGARDHHSGAAASRLLSGTRPAHLAAEAALAQIKGTDAALLFSSGYAAALGALTALSGPDDFIFLDRLSHASLIDGAKLSAAPFRPFRHNDTAQLDQLLSKARARFGSEQRLLIVAESVYSMDGDRAPVAELHRLAEAHDALLILDEAHALGVLGPQGRGLAAEAGIQHSERLIQLGTLSKAAGLQGGFLAARANWMELILNRARSFIYTTAVLPALAAAVPTALQLLGNQHGEARRASLSDHLHRLSRELNLKAPESAIISLPIGDEGKALARAEALRRQGFLIPAIRYPTVAKGSARLRLTLSATHLEQDLTQLIAALIP